MKQEITYVYGKHAVAEALRYTPHAVQELLLSSTPEPELKSLIAKSKIPTSPLKQKVLEYISGLEGGDIAHQGIVALIDSSALLVEFSDFFNSFTPDADTSIVVLGELQDPRNVGAIIRSAAGFGARAVLMPQNNQAQISGAVVKTSAGMVFRIPIVRIGNVNQTLRTLKERGFWIYGLAMEGANELSKEKFDAPAAFVIGNEGEGIREKTLENCDIRLSIPMHSRTESLNASVSAAVVLYEWSKHHPKALKI